MPRRHRETHRIERIGWLRAAVLGANDGIVSTASLIVGVAAAQASSSAILMTGTAGIVAGALSMAAGEYVSVSSQADTEEAERAMEAHELETMPAAEREELVGTYQRRGLDRELAEQVADQLMAQDALGAHLRDELGLSDATSARPIQAAFSSAASFALGAVLPLLTVILFPGDALIPAVAISSLLFLGMLGALGAHAGGANIVRAIFRVVFWGAIALAATAAIGRIFGTVV